MPQSHALPPTGHLYNGWTPHTKEIYSHNFAPVLRVDTAAASPYLTVIPRATHHSTIHTKDDVRPEWGGVFSPPYAHPFAKPAEFLAYCPRMTQLLVQPTKVVQCLEHHDVLGRLQDYVGPNRTSSTPYYLQRGAVLTLQNHLSMVVLSNDGANTYRANTIGTRKYLPIVSCVHVDVEEPLRDVDSVEVTTLTRTTRSDDYVVYGTSTNKNSLACYLDRFNTYFLGDAGMWQPDKRFHDKDSGRWSRLHPALLEMIVDDLLAYLGCPVQAKERSRETD